MLVQNVGSSNQIRNLRLIGFTRIRNPAKSHKLFLGRIGSIPILCGEMLGAAIAQKQDDVRIYSV